jgi:hypothetical protein
MHRHKNTTRTRTPDTGGPAARSASPCSCFPHETDDERCVCRAWILTGPVSDVVRVAPRHGLGCRRFDSCTIPGPRALHGLCGPAGGGRSSSTFSVALTRGCSRPCGLESPGRTAVGNTALRTPCSARIPRSRQPAAAGRLGTAQAALRVAGSAAGVRPASQRLSFRNPSAPCRCVMGFGKPPARPVENVIERASLRP